MKDAHTALSQQLEQQGHRYRALSPIDQAQVHIQFPGQFEGRQIVWNADLRTLAYESSLLELPAETTWRQYIHIHPAEDECIPITVALNVPQFDEPTILKTLIMIHNYKRLREGRHEFGEPVSFSN